MRSPIYNTKQHVSGQVLAHSRYDTEQAPEEPSTWIYWFAADRLDGKATVWPLSTKRHGRLEFSKHYVHSRLLPRIGRRDVTPTPSFVNGASIGGGIDHQRRIRLLPPGKEIL